MEAGGVRFFLGYAATDADTERIRQKIKEAPRGTAYDA